jgi:hypothetical protein
VANHRELPTAKQHDKELQSYYDATRQGIEPRSTKSKDIDAAVKLSNEAGKAFDGITDDVQRSREAMEMYGAKYLKWW